MTVEMSRFEAEVLIAVLTFAEGVAPMTEPAMVEAIKELRSVRSALVGAYLRSVGEPQSVGAVDPQASNQEGPSTREKTPVRDGMGESQLREKGQIA